MSDEYLQQVIALACVVQPVEQPTIGDWSKVESDLGINLPNDFKRLVAELGNGQFGEFCLLNPVSTSEYTRLSREGALAFGRNIRRTAQEAEIALYPEKDGFVRVGSGGNGMELLVDTKSSMDGTYELKWLELDYSRVYSIGLPLAQFLHDLYRGKIVEDWAREARKLIWESDEQFFTSRPGQQNSDHREVTA